MYHNCIKNNKINRLHEACLRLTYNNKQSLFHELLERYGSALMYRQNLLFLATEMFNITKGTIPTLVRNMIF